VNKKQRFAEKALRILFVYLVLFSITHTVLTAVTGVEQTTLIEQTFVVFGVEAGGLLLKRIVDKIFGRKNDDV
jgi:diacylglycerol kinase